MSGIAPIGPPQEVSPIIKEEELDRMEQKQSQPSTDETSQQVVKANENKQAEKKTIYGFQYTGMGSFIDKVF